jgi:membrane-associated phospholipid phosphatase
VVASEYADIKIVRFGSYALATIVGAARFAAHKHFASDVVAGAGMGWFIGRHVYNRWGTEPKTGPHRKVAAFMPQITPQIAPGAYGLSLQWSR